MAGENDTFEVYQDKKGEYRWRRTASNGNIVGASSEGYSSKKACEENMHRGYVATDKWEFYTDKAGEHRWRRTASNGNVVGASTEGYSSAAYAKENAARQGYKE
ncbi:YegP family protein [Pontivivens ytuae]|uniref:YegP family protein n=1 Tax=Pontivivens ytuae TaxID=2789856 RepID=A0A7S9LNT5_9RHOB|nr:DUF1508 domain-containing protein [Pontivivens ytuae]QPH52434.1 YegP family protein [Pontivivens ytuae]